jgi:hypothetical protein
MLVCWDVDFSDVDFWDVDFWDVGFLRCFLWHAGSPGDEGVIKRRRMASRGRDFVVKIEFAAKIRRRNVRLMLCVF